MDTIALQRRYPDAYDQGRNDRLRDRESNPYTPPPFPNAPCPMTQWHAYNAGWDETRTYNSEAA